MQAKSPEVSVIRGGGRRGVASAAKESECVKPDSEPGKSNRKRKAADSEEQTASGGEQIKQASSDKKSSRKRKVAANNESNQGFHEIQSEAFLRLGAKNLVGELGENQVKM